MFKLKYITLYKIYFMKNYSYMNMYSLLLCLELCAFVAIIIIC